MKRNDHVILEKRKTRRFLIYILDIFPYRNTDG